MSVVTDFRIDLRRDIATLTRAWDAGELSVTDQSMIGLALDAIWAPTPTTSDLAQGIAIIGMVAGSE